MEDSHSHDDSSAFERFFVSITLCVMTSTKNRQTIIYRKVKNTNFSLSLISYTSSLRHYLLDTFREYHHVRFIDFIMYREAESCFPESGYDGMEEYIIRRFYHRIEDDVTRW